MKKTITILFAAAFSGMIAQTVADFESFTLTPNSFYKDTNSVDFQTSNAIFQYDWDKSFGGFWSQGFSYTNKNDSTNGGYTNLYNCIAYKGYNNSNFYVAAQANGVIQLKTSTDNVLNGFYFTNSTYAYKSMKNGDSFAKKFGGPSGNDPDFFKVTVKGYLGGTMKTDSTEFYLADFRYNNNTLDYIVRGWQWVNCSNLGVVDSVKFFMYSSDNGSFGMNTPAFFCLDNFTTSKSVGINELSSIHDLQLYPNPASEKINLRYNCENSFTGTIKIAGLTGLIINEQIITSTQGWNHQTIDISHLESGIYFIELLTENNKQVFKLIKN